MPVNKSQQSDILLCWFYPDSTINCFRNSLTAALYFMMAVVAAVSDNSFPELLKKQNGTGSLWHSLRRPRKSIHTLSHTMLGAHDAFYCLADAMINQHLSCLRTCAVSLVRTTLRWRER